MRFPSFQFYPGDWLHDPKIQMLSWEAKGLWIDLMCWMHNDYHYGYLRIGNEFLDTTAIKRLLKANTKRFDRVFKELLKYDVIGVDELGFHSRRMVKDESLRRVRAQSGKLGGNPRLLNQMDNQKLKQKPTPSSSSSSSSSINILGDRDNPKTLDAAGSKTLPKQNKEKKVGTRLPKDWEPSAELLAICKAKRPDLNIESTAEVFRDYWASVPGSKGLKLDWDATFRVWVSKQHAAKGVVTGSTTKAPSNRYDWLKTTARAIDRITGDVYYLKGESANWQYDPKGYYGAPGLIALDGSPPVAASALIG